MENDHMFLLADNQGHFGLYDLLKDSLATLLIDNPFTKDAMKEGDFNLQVIHQSCHNIIYQVLKDFIIGMNLRVDNEYKTQYVNYIDEKYIFGKINRRRKSHFGAIFEK